MPNGFRPSTVGFQSRRAHPQGLQLERSKGSLALTHLQKPSNQLGADGFLGIKVRNRVVFPFKLPLNGGVTLIEVMLGPSSTATFDREVRLLAQDWASGIAAADALLCRVPNGVLVHDVLLAKSVSESTKTSDGKKGGCDMPFQSSPIIRKTCQCPLPLCCNHLRVMACRMPKKKNSGPCRREHERETWAPASPIASAAFRAYLGLF